MESKEEMPVKLLCMACLSFGRNLRELKNEKLKEYYLNALREVPLYGVLPMCPVVCWECEALLKKAYLFKEQCKDSYRILQTYTNEYPNEKIFSEVMYPPTLGIYKCESISLVPNNRDFTLEGVFVHNVKMENGNVLNESDVLDVTNEVKCVQKRQKLSKHKHVYVKEECSEFDQEENGLDATDVLENTDCTSESVEVKADSKSSIGEKEDRKRKKKSDRVKGKKRIKSNKENLKQCHLVDKTYKLLTIDKQELNAIQTNDQDLNVEGVFIYGDDITEDETHLDVPVCNEIPHKNVISGSLQNEAKEKITDDLKEDLQKVPVEFDDDLDNSNAIQNGDVTRVVDIEVALKTLIGAKERKRKKKLKRLNGKKTKGDNELKQKLATKILTVDMSYEEMVRDRERERRRERYVNSEYRCESCILGFSHEGAYREHNKRRHDKSSGNYSCPICKTVIPSMESFTAHYKRHTRRYECAICHKRTLDLKVMQQHYYSIHEISLKEYKCSICGKISESIEAHRYHKDSHKARIQCPECEKTYRHRAGLMNHRVAVHEFRNAFPCNKCDKVFRWKTSLKRHYEKHEIKGSSNAAPAFCYLCDVTFASISSYQRHLKNSLKHVSQDQLKYICDHCNRRFADKTKLRDHIEEKHLYKKFQCHICLKPSKNRVGLDQHIRNVHKGRPYNAVCHYCGKRFPTTVQLESHVRTHTGERPFSCEYCPATFSQRSNLYKHSRQVHLNIKTKRLLLCKKRKDDRPQNDLVDNPTAGDGYPTATAIWRYSPQRGIIM